MHTARSAKLDSVRQVLAADPACVLRRFAPVREVAAICTQVGHCIVVDSIRRW